MQTRSRRCWLHIRARRPRGSAHIVLLSVNALAVALLTATADAQTADREFDWEQLQRKGRILAGTVLPPDRGSTFHRLRLQISSRKPTVATVLVIERPRVSTPRYAVRGQVRYEGVEGTGYLEMWNHFAGGASYFSRTLADAGPLMKLQGTSGWREFELPFDATGASAPTRLVINVVLQGRGTVYLGPLQLLESGLPDTDARGRLAGLTGAVAGTILGGLGAAIGTLTSFGRARQFVLAATRGLAVAGLLALVSGLIAWSSSGSPTLYHPLILGGILTFTIPIGVLPAIRKRYEEIELRRMRAHDVG